ncbi:MAG: hypothetical protein COB76_06055 [Alphaproteobacteria bacterium]|nr:MAG: hypothetical protein COB76_06055 [Alphaproteobacteria bacterium]
MRDTDEYRQDWEKKRLDLATKNGEFAVLVQKFNNAAEIKNETLENIVEKLRKEIEDYAFSLHPIFSYGSKYLASVDVCYDDKTSLTATFTSPTGDTVGIMLHDNNGQIDAYYTTQGAYKEIKLSKENNPDIAFDLFKTLIDPEIKRKIKGPRPLHQI